jgi:hypothetical protein
MLQQNRSKALLAMHFLQIWVPLGQVSVVFLLQCTIYAAAGDSLGFQRAPAGWKRSHAGRYDLKETRYVPAFAGRRNHPETVDG